MLTALSNQKVTGKIRIRNSKKQISKETLYFNLYNREYKICEIKKEIQLKDELFTDINIDWNIESDKIELWDIDNPMLYRLDISLENKDLVSLNLGFRDIKITENGFFLNDKRIKLRGLNRHQSFPYVGYAMPERIQKRDADILKFDLGLNIVRSSHYPPSKHFLDRCDEIGLLVFEEIPNVFILVVSLTISIVSLIHTIELCNRISHSFNHKVGYTIGLLFLPAVFLLILGLKSDEYKKVEKTQGKI